MCVLIFSTIFVWNISHSKKSWARYNKKYIYWPSCKVPVILNISLRDLEFSRQIFLKKLSFQISWKPTRLDPGFSMHTDGHGRPAAFRNFENAPKNSPFCHQSAFIRFVWISEQTDGTPAFQNMSLSYHHCPLGFLPRSNSVETFINCFWLLHATTAYRQKCTFKFKKSERFSRRVPSKLFQFNTYTY